jgi:hypothetical protein
LITSFVNDIMDLYPKVVMVRPRGGG